MIAFHRLSLALLLALALHGCAAQDAGHVETTAMCDCTDECTKMADARVRESEQEWMQQHLESLAQKNREELEASHKKEMDDLKLVLEEAQQAAEASLQRANSLRKEHEDTLVYLKEQVEQDKQSFKEAQDELVTLRAQMETLRMEKEQLEGLKRQVAFMNKEKEDLQDQNESLTKDLNDLKSKLRNVNDKYLESSQNLLKADEQYRELYKEYSTTYINLKVIQHDIVTRAQKTEETVVTFWNETIAPYWDMISKMISPWIQFVVSVVGPVLKSLVALLIDLFHRHVLPFWYKEIYPKIQPTMEPLMDSYHEAMVSLSAFIREKSHDIYSYVNLLGKGEDCSKIRASLLSALEFGEKNSDRVVRILERTLLLFVGYWIVAGFVALRRHRKRKRAQRQAHLQPSGLAYGGNLRRKKNQ